jgi:hypothetical protein
MRLLSTLLCWLLLAFQATTFKDVRSYPCRSMESAIKLVERFIAGVTKPARRPTLNSRPSALNDHLPPATIPITPGQTPSNRKITDDCPLRHPVSCSIPAFQHFTMPATRQMLATGY